MDEDRVEGGPSQMEAQLGVEQIEHQVELQAIPARKVLVVSS